MHTFSSTSNLTSATDIKWVAEADRLQQFLVTAGRYPSTSSSDLGERRTAKWLNSQKSAARRGSSAFTDERRAYLTQAVPLWADRHPTHQSQPDERWLAIAAEYGDFFIVHARHPFVGAVEEDERRLNSWATVQRAEARSGEPWLTAERLTVLAQVIPGWGGREPRQVLTCRWRAAAEELREFVNTASRLPSSAADDEFERQIGTWLECQSRGPLSEAKRTYLDTEVCSWDSRPDSAWLNIAARLQRFVAVYGVIPRRRSGNATEAVLGDWVITQGRKRKRVKFSEESAERWAARHRHLNTIVPGWATPKASKLVRPTVGQNLNQERWVKVAAAVATFHTTNGFWPSHRAEDPAERTLGVWLYEQRRNARTGVSSSTPERRAHLDSVAPGWSSGAKEDVWEANAQAVALSYRDLGCGPSPQSDLGSWLGSQRRSERGLGHANISDTRIARLDELAPDWRVNQILDAA